MSKVSENFMLQELIHPDIYKHPAIGDRAIDFIHSGIPFTLEALKKNLSRELADDVKEIVTVNDWMFGGKYVDSGLRLPNSKVGAPLSAHRFGTAVDCKFKYHTAEQAYYHILNNQDKYPFISRVEGVDHTPTWLHVECTEHREGDVQIFNP